MPESSQGIPDAERLPLRERVREHGRRVLLIISRQTEAFTGVPSAHEQMLDGIAEAENFANHPPQD